MSAQAVVPLADIGQVRALSANDVEAVIAIEREIYPFPWTAENFHSSLGEGYWCWGLESDHRLIGYAILMKLPDEIHLLNLGIAANCQGRGIGRCLLNWLADQSAMLGARSMLLEVRPSNHRAHTLYERSGFSIIGWRKRYYPSVNDTREDAWVMRLSLENRVVERTATVEVPR